MKLSGHESRRLQELEQRLAVEDPDLASLLSTGLDEPRQPEPFSPRHTPHGPPSRGAQTAAAMLTALLFLGLLVIGAHALSSNKAAETSELKGPNCHAASQRGLDCNDLRHYTPGG
jgi:hypothetical protein